MSALSKIPMQRKMLYILLLSCMPIIFAIVHLLNHYNYLNQINSTIDEVEYLTTIKENKQFLNITVRNYYREADHFYIDKYVESLTFLEPEVENLQKIINHKNFTEDDVLKQRLEFLTSANTLIFAEGVVQSYHTFQETMESLVHPVEVNASDLCKILSTIEGVNIGNFSPGPSRPQLMITDFKLDKKKTTDKNEVYVMDMKLLKREFI